MEFINSAWCISTDGFVSEAVGGYLFFFLAMGQAFARLPLAVAYGIWSGLGMALGAGLGMLWLGDRLDWRGVYGLALIGAGIALANQNRPLSARIRIDTDTQMKRFRAFQQILSIAPMALPMNLGSVSIHSAGITP